MSTETTQYASTPAQPTRRELRELPLTLLKYDVRVQRQYPDDLRAAKMAQDWDESAQGVITVSHRSDGDHIVVDGWTRSLAKKLKTEGKGSIPAEVLAGLTLEMEAALFRRRNNTRKISPIDLFLVRVVEHEPAATELNRIISDHGWKVAPGAGAGRFSAVRGIERIYAQSPEAARRTVEVLTKAWGHNEGVVNGYFVEGMGKFFVRYREQVNDEELIAKLSVRDGGAVQMLNDAKSYRAATGMRTDNAVADLLVREYNKNRKLNSLKRLEPWMDQR